MKTSPSIISKQDYRKLQTPQREALRERGIALLESGMSKKEVAALLGISLATAYNWYNRYKSEGRKGIPDKKRGARSEKCKRLTKQQELIIQKLITDKYPDQYKLPFALWTRKAVKELIKRQFDIDIAISTTGYYLRDWGFTPQVPKKLAYEQNPSKVQKWLSEEYPAIKERAKKENAEIHWGDETGCKNQCNHGRSYAPKGMTPIKKSMSKRFSVNMISTITNQGKVQFMIYSESMNADKFIEFMQQLIKSSDRKIFLILDNLRVHHSKIVKAWVTQEEIAEKIELFFLPSYSPERNPDEYLNCNLKYALSEKPAPRNVETLQNNVESHMLLLQGNDELVKSFFMHKDIEYAAADENESKGEGESKDMAA